jgi:cytochrome c oxidase subunit 2
MPTFVPDRASNFAGEYDALFWLVTGLTIFFTTLVFLLVVFFAVKYRRGSAANRRNPKHHNTPFEVFTISFMLVIALGVFGWSASLFARMYGPAPKDAIEIFVVGKQWMWHLQHANGVRENNELHVPVGKPVKLNMISQDVIHSFYVPAFRIKKDVIPGYYSTQWFTPTKEGRFRLFCAEYCGTEHSEMTGWVTVMKQADFDAWLASGGESRGATRRSMEESGEQIYLNLACNNCHGLAPARAPSLVGLYMKREKLDNGQTVSADERYLRESIREPDVKVVEGYQPVMPSYKNQLNEDQILQLISFIKSLRSPTPSGATGSAGAASTGQAADAATMGSTNELNRR